MHYHRLRFSELFEREWEVPGEEHGSSDPLGSAVQAASQASGTDGWLPRSPDMQRLQAPEQYILLHL